MRTVGYRQLNFNFELMSETVSAATANNLLLKTVENLKFKTRSAALRGRSERPKRC